MRLGFIKILVFSLVLIFTALFGWNGSKLRAETTPLSWGCLTESSLLFQVPISMILIVLDTERGTVGKSSLNKNGTRDYGPMQINSIWLPRLKSLGITEELLRDNGCVNVAVGAWILREHLEKTGDPMVAISIYHSRVKKHRERYLKQAMSRAKTLDVMKTLSRANGKAK
jgi:hypothetical protein